MPKIEDKKSVTKKSGKLWAKERAEHNFASPTPKPLVSFETRKREPIAIRENRRRYNIADTGFVNKRKARDNTNTTMTSASGIIIFLMSNTLIAIRSKNIKIFNTKSIITIKFYNKQIL